MNRFWKALCGGLAFLGISCAGPAIDAYKDTTPVFKIQDYMDGELEAWGTLKNRNDQVIRRFKVDITGTWEDNKGVLYEKFIFDDGETDERIWQITLFDDHNFIGTAEDVVGQAKGSQYGHAVNMNYVLKVPVNNTSYDIKMDDWLYMIDDKTVLNTTRMSKYGFTVGTIHIAFRKKD